MVMETLNSFNLVSVTVRLLLAMASGGLIGYGRSRKKFDHDEFIKHIRSINGVLEASMAD